MKKDNHCPSGKKKCMRTINGGQTCIYNGREYWVKGFLHCPFKPKKKSYLKLNGVAV